MPTFDTICFRQLCTIGKEFFGNIIPSLPFIHTQINMSTGKLVGMKPNIFLQAKLYELLIYKNVREVL
jgi:hypothetical protein